MSKSDQDPSGAEQDGMMPENRQRQQLLAKTDEVGKTIFARMIGEAFPYPLDIASHPQALIIVIAVNHCCSRKRKPLAFAIHAAT